MNVSRTRTSFVISGAALLGLSVGGGVVAFASEAPHAKPTITSASKAVSSAPTLGLEKAKMPDGRAALEITPAWSVNEFGLTVGSPTVADIRAGNLPDLVPSLTDDGRNGFLIARDNYFPLAKNPAEASTFAKRQQDQIVDGERVEQVFGPDGRTFLGTRSAGHFSSE